MAKWFRRHKGIVQLIVVVPPTLLGAYMTWRFFEYMQALAELARTRPQETAYSWFLKVCGDMAT